MFTVTMSPRVESITDWIAKAYDDAPYQQLKLFDSDRLSQHLGDRGILLPAAELRETPIMSVMTKDGREMWHPYQSWQFHILKTIATRDLSWRSWIDSDVDLISDFVADFIDDREQILTSVQKEFEEFYELLYLLSLVESFYLPVMRGQLTTAVWPGNAATSVDYWQWRRRSSPRRDLNDSLLDASALMGWHQRLSVEASLIDDTREWYLLIRRADYSKRDRLRGNARLAHDFYEMAEMIRTFLKDAYGRSVPREDEYRAGPYRDWQRKRYGLEDSRLGDRLSLKRLAQDFGLDGSLKGLWFVEGETEMEFFTRLALGFGYDLNALGIKLMNLGGTGRIERIRKVARDRLKDQKDVEQFARALRDEEVFTFLTIDDDPGVKESLEPLEVQALFTASTVVWEGDFEKGNFSVDELIEAACSMQNAEIGESDRVRLREDIESERENMDGSGRPKALGRAFEDTILREAGFETFGKGVKWGEALADLVLKRQDGVQSNRPAVAALRRALSMIYADFLLTLEKSEAVND